MNGLCISDCRVREKGWWGIYHPGLMPRASLKERTDVIQNPEPPPKDHDMSSFEYIEIKCLRPETS